MSKNRATTVARARRTAILWLAMLVVSLLICARTLAQSPQENESSQTKSSQTRASQTQSAQTQSSQTEQADEKKQAPTATPRPQSDLTQLSIENLMNLQVTSASKKEQKISQVAAAIYVITQEDIRNSGALNIPDLLRMVPGLDVAQINANTWAISSRGFNFQFANKLLVLIDGRALYTPLFGGVNWDTVDVPLEDIDRIEVIRGPGGTVWGTNAVNGVINIITKKASETRGVLLTGGGGTQVQQFGTLQYGGKIEEDTNYRVFAKYTSDDHSPNLNGQESNDGWHLLHAGFRTDTSLTKKDTVTTQGDIYTGEEGSTIVHSVLEPVENINVERLTPLSGGDVLTRWDHVFSGRSDTSLLFYFDSYERNGPEASEARNTFDIDFQHHIAVRKRHDVIWGAEYRHTADQTEGTIDQAFLPADESGDLFSAFIQDEITLKPDRVVLYIGSKLQNNYFSGFDYEPSARVAWTPNTRTTFWGAISRASRAPTRRDKGIAAVLVALPGPAEVALLGNPGFQSEHVVAYEVGYRAQPRERLSVDVTVFFNNYHDLESEEALAPFFDPDSVPPVEVIPKVLENKLYGTTEGVEAYAKWKITNRWTLSPGYSFLEMHLHTQPGSLDMTSVADAQGSNPVQQAQLRSHVELSKGFAWDTNAYFVDRLPAQFVPSYTRLDSQLSWRLREGLAFSVTGQNLLQDHHVEFNDQFQSVNSSQVKRSVYGKLTWQF